MTPERSQEAVEASERAMHALTGGRYDDTRTILAAADAVDPCVPVRVLREWIESCHRGLIRGRHDAQDFGRRAVLDDLSALLDRQEARDGA